jgi:hypothetical protein
VKRIIGLLLSLFLSALFIVPASGASAAPYCGIWWGSLDKQSDPMSSAPVVNIRTGQHACYDRLVVDVNGAAGGYDVRYVSEITGDASGLPIPTRGGAFLQIAVHNPSDDIDTGSPTYNPANPNELTNVTGYRTFRQVVSAGGFEGYTAIGLGVRARLPFRVFTLSGPGGMSRIVIDVAHQW